MTLCRQWCRFSSLAAGRHHVAAAGTCTIVRPYQYFLEGFIDYECNLTSVNLLWSLLRKLRIISKGIPGYGAPPRPCMLRCAWYPPAAKEHAKELKWQPGLQEHRSVDDGYTLHDLLARKHKRLFLNKKGFSSIVFLCTPKANDRNIIWKFEFRK